MPNSKKNSEFSRNLYRSEKNKIIAGIAGGLGEYFNIDPVIIRVIFVVLALFGGAGIPLYLIFWLVIPKESDLNQSDHTNVIKQNVNEIKEKTKEFTKDSSKQIFGFILVILGVAFLLDNFGFYISSFVWKLWPLLFIIFGYMILTKNDKT